MIKENKIVIITESVEDEKVEVLKSLLSKHDVQEEDILVKFLLYHFGDSR